MKDSKQKIREIIRRTIEEVAFEELAKIPEANEKKRKQLKMTKSQQEDQIHNDMFFGGGSKESDTRFRINENKQIKISAGELSSFQQDFSAHLSGHIVDFIKQRVGDKESIISFPIVNNTPDAVSIGVVDNQLKFKMSLRNGLVLNTENFKITDENKELAPKLYNLYNTIFKKKFTELLSAPESETSIDNIGDEPTQEMPAPTSSEADVDASVEQPLV